IRDITERKRAEEALRENESYLKSILHSSPVLQFVLDKNHRVVSWNRAIEKYSGIKEAEVLGTRDQWKAFYDAERPVLADLIVDEAVEKLPELYPGKFNKSPFVEGAYEVTDFFPKMGTRGVWLHFTTAPIRDVKGAIIGAVETLEDITERKRAEEEVKRIHHNYETFFNTIDEFLFVLDEEGRILHTNETVIRRFGYTREELIGQPVLMLHPPELRNESKRIMQELVAGTMDFCPLPVMTKDGHLITVESLVTKCEWDGKPVLFGVCKDISEIRL
ncbi:MAG: PAS domain S-box protein, partial [Candidatus Atribacteria bacterium]|nr:PAS domain S-box protein [Candidatus Atribacteria bacterium]